MYICACATCVYVNIIVLLVYKYIYLFLCYLCISTYTCDCSCVYKYIYLGQLVASTGRRQPWEKCGVVSDDGNNYKRLLTMKIRVRSVVLIETAGKYWIIDSFISETCISCLLYNHN